MVRIRTYGPSYNVHTYVLYIFMQPRNVKVRWTQNGKERVCASCPVKLTKFLKNYRDERKILIRRGIGIVSPFALLKTLERTCMHTVENFVRRQIDFQLRSCARDVHTHTYSYSLTFRFFKDVRNEVWKRTYVYRRTIISA